MMRTLRPSRFDCPACGPGIAVDEDGCCATCGADAVIRSPGDELWIGARVRPVAADPVTYDDRRRPLMAQPDSTEGAD
jgi:hypothetical protein